MIRKLFMCGLWLLLWWWCSIGTWAVDSPRSSGGVGRGRSRGPKNQDQTSQLIGRLINRQSDSKTRPDVYGPPVNVKCDFYVASFGSINAIDMDFMIDIHFRQRWLDPRLDYTDLINNTSEPVIIPSSNIENLWTPDLYFPNEKAAYFHVITVPNKSVKIYPNGTVLYSCRLTLKLSCPMYLAHFPMDYQVCHFKISSYSYETSDLKLDWFDNDSIEIYPEHLSLPHFELQQTSLAQCTEHLKTGNFDCLQASFHLRRQYGFYMLQAYIPCILIVILSWLSFWINKESVPARITLGVTTVLAMATALSSSLGASMSVSYAKALDVWYAFCMIIVFSALLEFALVNVLARTELQKGMFPSRLQHDVDGNLREVVSLTDTNDANKRREIDGSRNRIHQPSTGMFAVLGTIFRKCLMLEKGRFTADGMDKLSRVLFPLCFGVFNVLYWVIYTQPVVYQQGKSQAPKT